MASPIEATPTLKGADARRLLAELEDVCSPAEAARRIKYAREQVAEMMRPKIPRSDAQPSK